MSNDDHGTAVQDNINRARSLRDAPVTDPAFPYRNLGQLLEEQVERNEQKVFLIYYSEEGQRREVTYHEFFEEACRVANHMQAMGLRHGDRVATVSYNHPDVVFQYFAAFLLGAVLVPINPHDDDPTLTCILKHSGARVAYVRDLYLDRILGLRGEIPDLKTVVQVGKRSTPDLPHLQTDSARLSTRFHPPTPVALNDAALVMYSCDKSLRPKGVVLEHVNLIAEALSIAEFHRLSDDQRIMCILPIHHVKGIVLTLLTPLAVGGGVVLNQTFQAEKFFERIAADRVTVVSVDAGLLESLIKVKLPVDMYKLAHFRHLVCATGPLTVDLARKFEIAFKRPVIHGYGLSEATACSSFVPADLAAAEHKSWLSGHEYPSVGMPIPVNEMMIQDAGGNECGEGERGEIALRGHNIMREYDGDPESTSAAFRDGWFLTGDEGYYTYDAEGRKFFFVVGKKGA